MQAKQTVHAQMQVMFVSQYSKTQPFSDNFLALYKRRNHWELAFVSTYDKKNELAL